MKTPNYKWLCMIFLLLLGCRDTSLVDVSGRISGFRIEGTVLDGLEQPVSDVPVALFYILDFLGNSPVPTREYTIETPAESVNIDVYDYENGLVRNLYAGTPVGPTIYVPWDRRRNSGNIVGSGVYFIRVTVGGELRHSYTESVNGNVTARTDFNGVFTIPGVHLPVGFSPAPVYESNGSFTGNYRITDWVRLEFTIGGTIYSRNVILTVNRINRVPVRIK